MVQEYLEFFAAAYNINGPARTKIVNDVLELTDLGYKRDALVDGLSRGMKQRLSIARVLVHDPKVLLLDEPAGNLDPRARIEMRELLKELQRRMGKTILISSHILPELADLCNTVGIIEQGELLYSGPSPTSSARPAAARCCTSASPTTRNRPPPLLSQDPNIDQRRRPTTASWKSPSKTASPTTASSPQRLIAAGYRADPPQGRRSESGNGVHAIDQRDRAVTPCSASPTISGAHSRKPDSAARGAAGGKKRRDLSSAADTSACSSFSSSTFISTSGTSYGSSDMADLTKDSAQIFQYMSYLQLGLVALLSPIFTAGAITQEKDSQTYDILLATPLTNGQIVLGSLLSRVFFVVALLVSGIPVFSITQIFGGVAIRASSQLPHRRQPPHSSPAPWPWPSPPSKSAPAAPSSAFISSS